MIFFSLAEIFNKASGFVILAIISRHLGFEQFALYASVLVVFGYCVELASYSYQTKNLFSATKSLNLFLYSESFILRIVVTFITSLMAFSLFLNYFPSNFYFHVLPVAVTLLFSAVTFDYLLYATGHSNYLVIARFISQIVLVITTYSYFNLLDIGNNYLFVLNFINSFLLLLLTVFFLRKKNIFSFTVFFTALSDVNISFISLAREFLKQTPVMFTRLFVLMVVTIEVPILVFFQSTQLGTVSVSHRIALILLPFLIFYINSKAKEIELKKFKRVMVFASIGACVFVLCSPVLVYFLFGESFSGIEENVTIYFFVIVFQTFINYAFYLSVKESLEKELLKSISLITISFSLALSLVCVFGFQSQAMVFFLIVLKAIFVVVMSVLLSKVDKLIHSVLILIPCFFSVLLGSVGYFEKARYILFYLTKMVATTL